MSDFLKKIGLIDTLTVNLNVDRREFSNALKNNVEEGRIGLFSEFGDVFSRSKKEYKGHVGLDSFEITRRRRAFEMNTMRAIAKGKFHETNDFLSVETQITAFTSQFMFFIVLISFFYIAFALMFAFADNVGGELYATMVPALFFHALFMIGIPYFMAKRSVRRMKYDLERELYYITRNKVEA